MGCAGERLGPWPCCLAAARPCCAGSMHTPLVALVSAGSSLLQLWWHGLPAAVRALLRRALAVPLLRAEQHRPYLPPQTCKPGCPASAAPLAPVGMNCWQAHQTTAIAVCPAPAGLVDASPRVQQACVTVLCQLLCSRQLAAAVTEVCLGSEAILEGLAGLLDNAGGCGWRGQRTVHRCGGGEAARSQGCLPGMLLPVPAQPDAKRRVVHGSAPALPHILPGSSPSLKPPPQPASPAAELLQAKGLVALALLCRTSTGLACVVSWQGLLPQIERLCARERLQGGGGPGNGAGGGDQYMTAVVTGLTQQMAVNVVPLLHQAAAAARVAWSPRASGGDGGASAALHPLEALLLLLGSVAFRPMVVCDGLITGLADMLAWEVGPGAAAGDPSLRQEVKVRQRLRSVHMHLRSVRVHF